MRTLSLPLAALLLAAQPACERSDEPPAADQETVESLLVKGQEAFKCGKLEEALQLYQKALEKQPRSAVVYNLIGMTYRFQYNQLRSPDLKEKEIAAFRKAVEADPNFVVALVNLGSSYFESGKKQEAAEQFRRVLELMPKHPEAEQLRKMIGEAGEPSGGDTKY